MLSSQVSRCASHIITISLYCPPDIDWLRVRSTGFLLYCFTVLVFTLIMIYIVAPRYGRSNPLVYISICSLVGSVSVMAIKGFGVAVKLTFAGNNQFTLVSTYVFMFAVAGCILVQMNYFNKALDTFSTNVCVRSPFFSPLTIGFHIGFIFAFVLNFSLV